MERDRHTRAISAGLIAATMMLVGCEVDSFFDPSRTGYFGRQPTMLPILDRIDVIESDESTWGETTGVMQEDLLPNDLTYILAPGDFLTVEVQELRTAEMWDVISRRIDATGNFRIAGIGDIRAAGRTVQEFEDHVAELMEQFVTSPRVYVHVEDPVAYTYTVEGQLFNPGMYTLRKADLRLNEALAAVGGVPQNTERIVVVRRVPLTEEMLPPYERDQDLGNVRPPSQPRQQPQDAPVDIEDLIDQLENDNARPGSLGMPHRELGSTEPAVTRRNLAPDDGEPGTLVPVDIDDLVPVRVADVESKAEIDAMRRSAHAKAAPKPPVDETFVYVESIGEWVRADRSDRAPTALAANRSARQDFPSLLDPELGQPQDREQLVTERIIEIPYDRLRVDSSYDVVVRPGDRIVVEGPRSGLVYISGEINRPGVFDLPLTPERLTLSRFIAAAGDLGPIAQPERVDLTRMIGRDREATIRINLAAIRRRTEPDIFIKPGDHIHIGTSWIATPLAVIRNGFRVTYGFGFLLDRNFGNDVFGAPPVNRQ